MVPDVPEEGFRVTDRRRHDSEVEARPVAAEARPAPAAPPPPRPAQPQAPERSLAGLFMMLASSAVVSMGEVADPVTGQRHDDLDQAAEIIDVLVLLREKTEGHRSAEESQVLDELVYDLQVRFVNARKRAG
ncbi:MAG: DUF1844 domain-containing protein [Candidatus Rokubacteria bacterium]|nr:DUF1844 domain-containing protein [Candidatus Rokubacteria bacterium]MBI2157973.1 DUF1844 domain-containing protein [Candidatus Rokubacteria bacterium]